jgi:hypothetical protein
VLHAKLKSGCHEVAAELGWDRLTAQMEAHYMKIRANSGGGL